IRESQLAGTMETLLSTQTSLSMIIVSSAAYPFLWTSFTVVLYLALGLGLFGVHVTAESWPVAALLLTLAIIVFSGVGILSASFVLVFKRGSPIPWLFYWSSCALASV